MSQFFDQTYDACSSLLAANTKTAKQSNNSHRKLTNTPTDNTDASQTGNRDWPQTRKRKSEQPNKHFNITTRMATTMSKRAPLSFKVERVTPNTEAGKQPALPANTKTPKRAKEQKTGREGRQFIAAHVMPDAAKQFKLLSVQRDTTTQNMLIEAINDLFAKYGLSRIA